MKISIQNKLTGLINHIDFKLFEDFNNQSEYLNYLINAMNINIESIKYIKHKTQEYYSKEHIKFYLYENGFIELENQEDLAKKLAILQYAEMLSTVCLEACMVHYKKRLNPDYERRKKLAEEYEKNVLGDLNEKKN